MLAVLRWHVDSAHGGGASTLHVAFELEPVIRRTRRGDVSIRRTRRGDTSTLHMEFDHEPVMRRTRRGDMLTLHMAFECEPVIAHYEEDEGEGHHLSPSP